MQGGREHGASTMMTPSTSRYDEIAEWYLELTRDWPPEPVAIVPDHIRGERVLDMACGFGTASRYLAQHGVVVTAVDVSEKLLARAVDIEVQQPLGIDYVHGDVTTTRWWDGVPFDGVVCNMALMDIDDLDGAVTSAVTVLKPGGWFSASVLHPCFPGGSGDPPVLSSWPPDLGYTAEVRWNTGGVGVRGHAGVNHRMLSTYINTFVRAGLAIEQLAEPESSSIPRYLAILCRRATNVGAIPGP
jgi:SAM-dependent methyltransferase